MPTRLPSYKRVKSQRKRGAGETEPQRMVTDRRYRYGDPDRRLDLQGMALPGSIASAAAGKALTKRS